MKQIEYLYDSYIKDFKCKYYMVYSTKEFVDLGDSINVFGVRVDKISKSGKIIATTTVDDIGINENDVRQFISILRDGQVTPITLEDIIKDNI